MSSDLEIRPARNDEWQAAFGFVFQATPESDRPARITHGIDMVRRGELQPEGILVALQGATVKGALVCLIVPGASALVWPPQAEQDNRREEIEDALLQAACSWLRGKQVRISQSLLTEQERGLGKSLLRNGFRQVTSLKYMRHDLSKFSAPRDTQLHFENYREANTTSFRATLERTYLGTLDCPELNGIRTMDEIIAGHLTQGKHDPGRWWLAWQDSEPVGVLMLTEIPEWKGWDLSYLGVIPQRRKQGIGQQLTMKALWEARQAGQSKLTLSVDGRNRSAQALYEKLGFFAYDSRDVYLALWPGRP
jgi:mycothiol synthase